MLIEHKVPLTDMSENPPKVKYEMHWNPSIDTRLYFSNLPQLVTRVDVLKSRHVVKIIAVVVYYLYTFPKTIHPFFFF
jgi:hypothetical protein